MSGAPAAPARRPTGPLSAVLAAFAEGATSLDEVSRRTGLGADVVAGAVDHLRRMGRIEARELSMGCPGVGCSSCPGAPDGGAHDGGAACCTPGGSATRRGPVLVQLTLRP